MILRSRNRVLWIALAGLVFSAGCGGGPSAPPPPPPRFVITTTTLPNATVGTDYSETLEADNGQEPFTWELFNGELPSGLALDADTGIISGVPTKAGNFGLLIRATDSSMDPDTNDPKTAFAAFSLAVLTTTPGNAERVSLSGISRQSDENSTSPAVSAQGRYVVFSSRATTLDLDQDDTNGLIDVYVRDTCRDQDADTCDAATLRASLGPVDATDPAVSTEGNNDSVPAAISQNGRYVAFASLASNLVANDTNNAWDIFMRDTCQGLAADVCTPATTRVSVASGGAEANGDSVEPVISISGRFVAFRSLANNLVSGDTNGAGDIFGRDTCVDGPAGCTPITFRVSLASGGSQGNGNSLRPSITPGGRFVAFESLATNLAGGDTNGSSDIFVRDTCINAGAGCTPQTIRASLANDGSEPNSNNFRASISSGGRFAAFESSAGNLVANDSNGMGDIFLRDTCLGAALGCVPGTVRISVDSSDAEFAAASSSEPSVDSAGRFIAFRLTPAGLEANDPNRFSEIYVRDTCQGAAGCVPQTVLVSAGPGGERVNGESLRPVVSTNGAVVVFQSFASNLVILADTNTRSDIFLVDLADLLASLP